MPEQVTPQQPQQPQLPPSLTSDEGAPPPGDQIIAEARRRFVLPAEDEAPKEAPVQNKGEQATPSEPEPEKPEAKAEDKEKPESEEDTPDQAEKRQSRRFERRIDRLHRQRAEAKAEAEVLRRELDEIKAKLNPEQKSGAPRIEEFDYDVEKFAEATRNWAEKQAVTKFEQQQRERQANSEVQTLTSQWEELTAKGEEKYEDFGELVGEMRPDNPISVAIMESEIGDEIAYHLAKNPDEAARIIKLKPVSQVRAIGKIEAMLSAKKDEPQPVVVQEKKPSRAPEPINPVSGGALSVDAGPTDQMPIGDWIRERRKQVYGKRR